MNLDDLLNQTEHRKYPPPAHSWLMTQGWDELLFAHWSVGPEQIQALLPPGLVVDTFDDKAWVGVVPFVMRRVRFARTPFVSEFLELNVRTYVTHKGESGVYFFSLDASNRLAVEGARISYKLPYFNAVMKKTQSDEWTNYESTRVDSRGKSCRLKVSYRPLEDRIDATKVPDGLAYFLTERYRLFTHNNSHILKAEVHHLPWPLQKAEAKFEVNTMLEPVGIELKGEPVLYYSKELSTLEWAPARVLKALPEPLLQKSDANPSFMQWLFGLENLMLPLTGRQLKLRSIHSQTETLNILKDRTPSHLVSRLKENKFALYVKTPVYLRPFITKINGVVQEDGQILARVGISRWAQGVINGPIAAAFSIGIGFAVSSYLLPHPILLFYAFLLASVVPLLSCLISVLICKQLMRQDLPFLIEHLESVCGSSDWIGADLENWMELPRHKLFSTEIIAGIVCGVIYLGIAFGLHAQAWNLWCEGKYKACADLCRPVASLAQAILGDDSATVADCKYYLAECYRCMGDTKKAKEMYLQAIDVMAKTLGEENPFYADTVYNLGRCQEIEGEFDKAYENYKKTLSIWKNSPLVGPRNMVYAKGLNRTAICLLKMNRAKEARPLMEECLKIDKAYKKRAGKSIQEDLNDLAAIDIALGDYDKAIEESKRSIVRKVDVKATNLEVLPSFINLCYAEYKLNAGGKTKLSTGRPKWCENITEANRLLGESTDFQLDTNGLTELSKRYEQKVKSSQVFYEVPIFDTRGNVTFDGKGRL